MRAKSTIPSQADKQSAARAAPESWQDVGDLLSPLLAAAAELHGAKTLADVLDPDVMRLAARMSLSTAIAEVPIDRLAREVSGFAADAIDGLSTMLDTMSTMERTIIERRLSGGRPETLAELGSLLGVTRERIRQIQAQIEEKTQEALGDELQFIALALKERFGHVAEQGAVEDRMEELLQPDQPIASKWFRQILIDHMGFTLEDRIYIDEQASDALEKIRANVREIADDVGLVSEEELVAGLPDEDWRRFWPHFRKLFGFHDLHGSFGIRYTAKARAKAAILSIGRPATRKEIAAVCGLNKDRVGGHLSNIPSVIRADKDRWGLREWVDDEYSGIPAEIIRRIDLAGGAAPTKGLRQEIALKFNVNPTSVGAYMGTAKFVIREGRISMASPSEIRLRPLDDVIDGRDEDGNPYWTFVVESRFLRGYSATGVPPEFAKALGCMPDESCFLRVVNLSDCRELSMQWRLSSNVGATIGYLRGPLRRLGLEPGQRARVTIREVGAVWLSAEDESHSKTAGR